LTINPKRGIIKYKFNKIIIDIWVYGYMERELLWAPEQKELV